jgi:isocitrate dehydrogenase
MATLFAWTGALRKRGELDGIDDLMAYADAVETAAIETIESGIVTGDLKNLMNHENIRVVDTEDFLREIAANIKL